MGLDQDIMANPFYTQENVQTEGKCLGICCERFPFGPSIRARREMIQFKNGERESWTGDDGHEYTHLYVDGRQTLEFITDLLIPLGEKHDDGREFHTCKHWDRETRLCTVYDQRPSFCRTYPNWGECDYAHLGCTFRRIEPAIPQPLTLDKNDVRKHRSAVAELDRHARRLSRAFIRRRRRTGTRIRRICHAARTKYIGRSGAPW